MVRLSLLAAALLSHAASAQTIDDRGAVPPPEVYYERPAFVAAAPSALTRKPQQR